MLNSPRDVVVGASNPSSTAAFLSMFGFEQQTSGILPELAARALYGLDGPADEVLMAVPDAELGRVRLIATPHPLRSFTGFDARPFALDLFSTDIEASHALAVKHGYDASPITDHHLGPVVIREVAITGPDQLKVTLLWQTAGRRPSILDREPDRLHSEVHAFVWSDSDLDGVLGLWEDLGLVKLLDVVLETPGLGDLVGVQDEDLKMRLTVLADSEARPIRVEFVEFVGKQATSRPSLPLAAGLHAPAFEVPDIDVVLAALDQAEVGPVVAVDSPIHPRSRAAAVVAPSGQLFEIWQSG